MARTFKYTYGYEPYETLPPVSAEDNGKVLGVSNGSYALVNGGGGGSSGLVVHIVFEDSSQRMDKTWQEIWDVAAAGGTVVVIDDADESDSVISYVTEVSSGNHSVTMSEVSYFADSADDYPVIQ